MTLYNKYTYIIDKVSETILNNLFLFFFIGDFLTRVVRLNSGEFHSYGSFLKLFVEIIFIIIFFKNKKWNSKIAKYIYIYIIIFFIGQVNYFLIDDFTLSSFFQNLFRLNTYLYLFLIIIVVEDYNTNGIIINNIRFVKKIGRINIPFVIIGLLFQVELFRSYAYSERFGSMGVLPSPGAASFFYIFLISILYIDYFKSRNEIKIPIELIVQLIIAFMLGTKVVIFFIIVLSFFHLCFLIKKAKIRNRFRIAFIFTFCLLFYIREKIEMLIMGFFSFSKEIYNEHGILTILFSTRDLFLFKSINYLQEKANIIVYLFGGINRKELNVEFEFYKMFLFLGLLGLVVYIHFLKKYFFLKNNNEIKKYIFIAIVLSAFLAGGLFYSVVSSFLFFIVLKYTEIMFNQENL